jgi:hypothetical protein
MPAAYPSTLKTFTQLVDGVDDVLAAHPNERGDEITAIETELGTNPRGTAADVKARLDASQNSDGTIKNDHITEVRLAAAAVSQAKLKTSIGEVSAASDSNQTLPGGQYGFYPQIKQSDNGTTNGHIRMGRNRYGLAVAGSSTYATLIFMNPEGGQTLYAQQRYVTASGQDLWVLLAVENATGRIVQAYQAADHPAYGNGGDFLKVPHSFVDYWEAIPAHLDITCIEREAARALIAHAKQEGKSILTLIEEQYRLGPPMPYAPIHTGRVLGDAVERLQELAPGITTRGLIALSPSEKQQRLDELKQREDQARAYAVQRAAARQQALAKFKIATGLTDDDIRVLLGIA